MINKIITFVQKAKEFLKGKKVYLVAIIVILQAVLTYIEQLLNINGISDLFAWIQNLSSNDATLHLLEGLGIFGLCFSFTKKDTSKAENKEDK